MRLIPMLAVATALIGGQAFAADTMPATPDAAPMAKPMAKPMMKHHMAKHAAMHSRMGHGMAMSDKTHGVTPLASDGKKIDNGPTTPDANKAYMGGGVILQGAPGAPAPTPMATPPGQTPANAVQR